MNDIRQCDVTSIEAVYLDCCLCDYFAGSNVEEILAIPAYYGMTYKQAYDAAIEEFHASSGWFDMVDGSGTLAEEAIHGLFAVMLATEESADMVADFTSYIEPVDDDDTAETVYLYIGLRAESDL